MVGGDKRAINSDLTSSARSSATTGLAKGAQVIRASSAKKPEDKDMLIMNQH
jgi:hypothetical protein